jgi:peptide/nickel transport system substrate-binding protein
MDALLEQAAEVASYRDAKPLFDAAQSILHQDQPYTFLYWQERLVGFSSRVRNIQANPQTPLFHLDGWWVPAEMRTR